jgi:hypothetical protein
MLVKTASARSLEARGHGHFRFHPAACVLTHPHWLPETMYLQPHIRPISRSEIAQFVTPPASAMIASLEAQ